jgi:OFA family oxalate/formate antiporter-like MFS transporter
MVLSGIVLVICTIGSMFMKTPPEGHMANAVSSSASTAAASKSYTTAEMLKTPQFYLMTATLLLACIGGLMIIGFAKPIAEAKGLVEIAAIGVVVVSVANASGRLFWGAVSDKIGRMNTIFILLAGTAIFSLFVNMATGYWIFVVIALIGFFYGGTIGTFPSLTADFFGPKHMAINYGVVLLGFGVGAIISSQIAGYYKNVAATDISLMFPAFLIASLCAIGGIGLMLILRFVDKKSKSAAS